MRTISARSDRLCKNFALMQAIGKTVGPQTKGHYEWRPTKIGLFGRFSCWVRSGLRHFGAFWPKSTDAAEVDTPFHVHRRDGRRTLRRTRRRSRRYWIRPKIDKLRGLATRRPSPLFHTHHHRFRRRVLHRPTPYITKGWPAWPRPSHNKTKARPRPVPSRLVVGPARLASSRLARLVSQPREEDGKRVQL